MCMNNLGQNLSIDFKPNIDLIESLKKSINEKQTLHFLIKKENRDVNAVKLIESLGFYVFHSELFYTPPFASRTIHVDGETGIPPYASIFKINWIIGGNNSIMTWFKTLDDYVPERRKTRVGTYAFAFDPEKCTPILDLQIKNCAIVQAGIPHTVTNYEEPRWAVSYVLSTSPTTNRLVSPDYEAIINAFSKFII